MAAYAPVFAVVVKLCLADFLLQGGHEVCELFQGHSVVPRLAKKVGDEPASLFASLWGWANWLTLLLFHDPLKLMKLQGTTSIQIKHIESHTKVGSGCYIA